MHPLRKLVERRRALRNGSSDRGGALLELAISIPIFVVILALIFDVGLGFSAARDSSSAARSAARVAALAGNERLADFRAIDAVRAEYGNSDDTIMWLTVYRSEPGGTGEVPAACRPGGSGVAGLCNVYGTAELDPDTGLTVDDFDADDCAGDPDSNWCPADRVDDDGDYLGVGVWTAHDPTIGLIIGRNGGDDETPMGTVELEDRAVFALFFPDGIEP
jgi:type II secretory pathway pseudopilin PulG